MRCSAKRVTKHKVTFSFVNGSATRNLHLIRRLRRHLSRCGSGRRGSRSPPETDSLPRPCFAALKGEAKEESCRTAREQTSFARIQKLSPLCTTSLLFVSPGLPVLRGVSGGGAALSPGFQLNLCSLPKHGAHSAAQPPERSFFFLVFLSAEKEKRRVSDAVGKSLSEIKIRHYLTVHTRSTSHPGTEGAFLKNIL